MCGLTGIYSWNGPCPDLEVLKRMASTLVHRGPDDEGFYRSESGSPVNVGLGFRRLSIIDLAGGHQPMSTADKKNWIVFNGEIYNFPELRKQLEERGHRFLTRCDTEVILHLYQLYGRECVTHLRGMFAFAIWDSEKRSIFLARDRIGKKPLFYAKSGNRLYFASEMKAILAAREIQTTVNPKAIPLYLAYQFIPSPMTIFSQIFRLPPGHTLVCNEKGDLSLERYWTVSRKPFSDRSPEDLCEELRQQIREATRIRLISDVPLGAFLSGGVDSSAVVGMMAQEMSEPVKTYSIGFEESDFSELEYARLVAQHFHTDHHEMIVKPDTSGILPKLAWHYDQPFADPSALPSYYVAKETRKDVTVALNGDGGDENFGGYLRYQADRIFSVIALVPRPLRKLAARSLQAGLSLVPVQKHLYRRITRAASLLGSDNPHEFNFNLFCYFDDPALKELLSDSFHSELKASVSEYFYYLYDQCDSGEFIDEVLACDSLGYLPDCLLVKMDIASMANSLEARSPLLDHKLIEFTARIPAKYKVKFNGGKWILKKALKDFLPEAILNRRKMGFGIPLGRWFRGPLSGFLREHILSSQARKRGYFNMEKVEMLVKEHQSGLRDHGYKLWALLMFELWHQAYVDR